MTRLFLAWFPIFKGDKRLLANFIKRQDIHISATKNLPAATSMWSILLWGSSVPGRGLMAVDCGLTIFRTRKHLSSIHGTGLEISCGCEESEAKMS